MNQNGFTFIKKAHADLKKSGAKFDIPKFEDSALQERMMRCGQEARAFEVNPETSINDLVSVAQATLINDYLKHD